MITSSRSGISSPLKRILFWSGFSRQRHLSGSIFEEDHFRFEVEKERCRVDRRANVSSFSVVLVDGIGLAELTNNDELILDLRQRLRITDSLGWCDSKLGILLPETCRLGAQVVAGELRQIALNYQLKIKTEILVYPDDDLVARNSQEFHQQAREEKYDNSKSPERQESVETNNVRANNGHACNGDSASRHHLLNSYDGVRNGLKDDGRLRQGSRGHRLFGQSQPTPNWKRALDIVGASLGIAVFSPVFVATAVAVRLSSPGPVFFRQVREGKDGVPFVMYKFRTMVADAESKKKDLQPYSEQDGPAFKIDNDPRVTKIGRFLRKSCIDELPQLWNVLTGSMSLVGPRPLPVCESFECLIWQRKRLQVAPGLTCIWQVRGKQKVQFSEWMRMDMEYIRKRSFWFDLKLIVQTFAVSLLQRGSS